jgi:polar amino acid transport system substrate-binding protein
MFQLLEFGIEFTLETEILYMKAKFVLRLFSILIILMGIYGDAVCSENQSDSAKTIVFGTIATESIPYFWKLTLIYSEAFKRLGYSFTRTSLPGERSLVDANIGAVDGVAARIASLDPDQYPNLMQVAEPIFVFKDGAYSVDTSIRINGWESLRGKGYVVGLAKGIKSVEQKLPLYVEKENIVTLTGFEQSLKMLQARRIDIFIASTLVEESALMKSDAYKDVKLVGIVEEKILYPWLNKKHQELAPRLADALKAMKADGTFQKIIEAVKQN